MFRKIDSYLASIILSQVDKYIKDFKSEDAQVSLWGGAVTLHNLELKQEIIQEEFKLPFILVSGHIHELVIQVPWLKVTSDPIVITINTIECVLKLRDGNGTENSPQARTNNPKVDDDETPPNYIQSLIARIVNNISFRCSNLIIKYVEEDIVLSVNIKQLNLDSVNGNWEPSLRVNLSEEDLHLRKLARLNDLTLCLDKRNAAGKVDKYLEPLLYRCEMEFRFDRVYKTISAKLPLYTRTHIHSANLEFSISNQQVPMLMRISTLVWALKQQNAKMNYVAVTWQPNDVVSSSVPPVPSEEYEESSETDPESPQPRTELIWPLVHNIPVDSSNTSCTAFLIGMSLDNVKFSFKVPVHTFKTGSRIYSENYKERYSTVCCLHIKSLITESSAHGIKRFSFLGGVREMDFYPENECVCGILDTQEESCGPKYLEFDKSRKSTNIADEVDAPSWPLEIDDKDLVERMTTKKMLEICPAIALSYVYEFYLTLSEDEQDYCHYVENTNIDIAMGPCCVLLCAGLDHRISLIRNAAKAYDYEPYYLNEAINSRLSSALSYRELSAMNVYLPKINMNLEVVKPKVSLAVWDHPTYKETQLNKPAAVPPKRKKSSHIEPGNIFCEQLNAMPLIVFQASSIKGHFEKPMYLPRIMQIKSIINHPEDKISENNTSEWYRKVYKLDIENMECFFQKRTNKNYQMNKTNKSTAKEYKQTPFITQLNLSAEVSTLPGNLSNVHQIRDAYFNLSNFSGCASMPRIMLAFHMLHGVVDSSICETGKSPLLTSTLLADAFADKELVHLECNVEDITVVVRLDSDTVYCQTTVGSIKAFAIEPLRDALENATQVWIVSGPDDSSNKALLKFDLQISENDKYPPFLILDIANFSMVMDPLLNKWFTYYHKSNDDKNGFSDDSLPGYKTDIISKQNDSKKPDEILNHGASTSRSSTRRSDLEKYFVHSAHSTSENLTENTENSEKDNILPVLENSSFQSIFSTAYIAKKFVDYSNVAIFVKLHQTTVYFPTTSLSALNYTEACHAIYKSLENSTASPDSVLVFRFQNIILKSSSLGTLVIGLEKPTMLSPDIWTYVSISFPWEVKISAMNFYSLSNKMMHPNDNQCVVVKTTILREVSSTTTIDVTLKPKNNTKCDKNKKKDTLQATSENSVDPDNTASKNFMTLGICVHMDTGSVKMSVNKDQVHLIHKILHGLLKIKSAKSKGKDDASIIKSRKIIINESISDDLSQKTSTSKQDVIPETSKWTEDEKEHSLSVWVQCTVSNIFLNCYVSSDDHNDQPTVNQNAQPCELKLVFGIEDVMGTLDADSEYIKLKLKIATGSIHHHKRESEAVPWVAGGFLGIILQGRESAEIRDTNDSNLFYLTMTKARCSSVHSLWKDSMRNTKKLPSVGTSDLLEVDVGLQMIDIILSPLHLLPFIYAFYPALLPDTSLDEDIAEDNDLPQSPSNLVNYLNAESWDARQLPLLYFKCTFIRIFIPLARDGVELSEAYTFMLGIKQISLLPHADEPICRVPLQREIYEKAARSGNIHTPGNVIEDRQCQFNILGVTVQNGLWEHIASLVAQPVSTQPAFCDTPLLGWNNVKDCLPEPLTASLLQITPQECNFTTVIALAMFYDDTLICGPAIECTAGSTTIIEFGLSHLQNLFYMYELYSMFIQKIKRNSNSRSSKNTEIFPCSTHIHREKSATSLLSQNFSTTSHSTLDGMAPSKKYDQNHFDAYITFDLAIVNIFDDRNINYPVKMLSIDFNELSLLFTKQNHVSKFQVLIYALSVGLGPPTLPAKENIPLNHIIETKVGAPDPDTEIHPMFFTGCWTFNMLSKKNLLDLTTGCPIEIKMSLFKMKQLAELKQLIESCLARTILLPCEEQKMPGPCNIIPITENTNGLWKLLDVLGKININIAPTIFKFMIEEDKVCELNVCINAMKYNVAAISRRPEKISIVALIEGLSIKLCEEDDPRKHFLVNPWSFGYEINLKWEKWSIFTTPIRSFLIETDLLRLDVCRQHLKIIKRFSDHFEKHKGVIKELYLQMSGGKIPTSEEKHLVSNNGSSYCAGLWDKTSVGDRHYNDDLRAGAFRSIFSIYSGKGYIQSFQMFTSQRSLTWKYPQPRTITKVHSSPFTFESATSSNDTITKDVVCHLECYCDITRSFYFYANFIIKDGQSVAMELDKVNENSVFSSMWRIVIQEEKNKDLGSRESASYFDMFKFATFIKDPFRDIPVNEEKSNCILPVTPQLLFDSLTVDSFFAPNIIPTVTVLLKICDLELNLFNDHMQRHLPPLCDPMNLYKSDAAPLAPYIFFNISLNNMNFYSSIWNSTTAMMRFNSNVVCNMVEGSCLSLKDVIKCNNLSGRLWSGGCAENINGAVVKADSLTVRGGPHNTTPLMASIQCWSDFFHQLSKNSVKSDEEPTCSDCLSAEPDAIIQKYAICNDTTVIVRVKQLTTSESIDIGGRETHLYSWRSPRLPHIMEVSIPSANCTSAHFMMDVIGLTTVDLLHNFSDQKITLVVLVESISPVQLSVTIMGRLIIMNSLPQSLELKILKNRDAKDLGKKYFIEEDTQSPSLFIDVVPDMMFRIRIMKSNTGWSGRIPLKECKSAQLSWMVKVPMENNMKFISVWCRVLTDNENGRTLIIISPLYRIRSHLPLNTQVELHTEEFDSVTEYTVAGKGSSQALTCPGTSKTHHKLTFANVNAKKLLNEEMPLHFGMVNMSTPPDKENTSIESILKDIETSKIIRGSDWPYICDYSDVQWTSNDHQLAAETTIRYLCPVSSVATITVDMAPWAILGNCVGSPISLHGSNGQRLSILQHHTVMTPPSLMEKELFFLGIQLGTHYYLTDPLSITTDERGPYETIPKGHVQINMYTTIPIKCRGSVSILTISYDVKENINILCISSKYICINQTDFDLLLLPLAIPQNSTQALQIPEGLDKKTIDISKKDESNMGRRITVFHKGQGIGDINEDETWALYIQLALATQKDSFSCPMRVDNVQPRTPRALKNGIMTIPIAVTCQESRGQIFITLHNDPYPEVLLENNSSMQIAVGQVKDFPYNTTEDYSSTSNNHISPTVVDECTHSDWRCILDPGTLTYYTLPTQIEKYPTIDVTPADVDRLQLAFAYITDIDGPYIWSCPVTVSANTAAAVQEQSINLPGYQGKIKIKVVSHFHSTVVTIDNVTEDDISASDIRSRLIENMSPASESPDNISNEIKEIVVKSPNELSLEMDNLSQSYDRFQSNFKLIILLDYLNITLTSDNSVDEALSTDIICLTGDDIVFTSTPNISGHTNIITAGNLQLDNPLYPLGGTYCFGVIFISQKIFNPQNDEREKLYNFGNINVLNIVNTLRNNCLFTCRAEVEVWNHRSITNYGLSILHISLEPISTYFEHIYLLKLKDYITDFIPTHTTDVCPHKSLITLVKEENMIVSLVSVPEHIVYESYAIARPIRFRRLQLDDFNMILSLNHYIAVDHSPLQFASFDRLNVSTSSYQLGCAIMLHYLPNSIFRLVWVVGSLEMIGSPASLVRQVNMGLRDLVREPCRGLMRGPLGFLVGMLYGSRSLLRHVTQGTLKSLGMMMGSVARGFDRLSLDEEHIRRTELARRNRPDGLAQALNRGLRGLGLSLLGGVVGIPHETIVAGINSRGNPLAMAVGFSCGVLGAVTKPLSATADFLAFTGQGLLKQAGWDLRPKPRWYSTEHSNQSTCALNQCWRLLLSDSPVIHICHGVLIATEAPVVIMITDKILAFANPSRIEIETQYDIALCSLSRSNLLDGEICIEVGRPVSPKKQSPQGNMSVESRARVAAYLGLDRDDMQHCETVIRLRLPPNLCYPCATILMRVFSQSFYGGQFL